MECDFQDGRIVENVDALIFATGYGYGFPFLKGSSTVTTDDRIVYPVYKHIFHPNHTSLAFTSLSVFVVLCLIDRLCSSSLSSVAVYFFRVSIQDHRKSLFRESQAARQGNDDGRD